MDPINQILNQYYTLGLLYKQHFKESKEITDLRINSLACNVFGIMVTLSAAAAVPIAIVLTICSIAFPVILSIGIPTALVALTSAVALGILAYFLISYGDSYDEEANEESIRRPKEALQALEQLKYEPVTGLTLLSENVQIPIELCEEIFSYLESSELTNYTLVSKEWYKVAYWDRIRNRTMERIAIGPEMWKQKLNADIGKADPIPMEMLKILKQPCPIFEGCAVRRTHILVWIPATLNGKPLTLNSLYQFFKTHNCQGGFAAYGEKTMLLYGNEPVENTGWVLMSKFPLPGSSGKSYSDQKRMVAQLGNYEVPKILEATFCIFAQFYKSGEYLYDSTYIRCQEPTDNKQEVIGNFDPSGLNVGEDWSQVTPIPIGSIFEFDSIGIDYNDCEISAIRKNFTDLTESQ